MKRYTEPREKNIPITLNQAEDGNYVLYEDAEKLEQRVKELEKVIKFHMEVQDKMVKDILELEAVIKDATIEDMHTVYENEEE